MGLLKHEIDISSIQQLDAYIETGHGDIKGSFWREDGDHGFPVRGTYSRQIDNEPEWKVIVFSGRSLENATIIQNATITDELVALGGISVFSRRKIAV